MTLQTGIWLFPEAPAPELVALTQRAEAAGLEEIWLGDEGPAREPFTVLAAAAGVTSHIRLGVGVTNPFVRHPGLAATTMLTVHELSQGRAILGVGAGGQMSLSPFGIEPSRPVSRVRDFLSIARAVHDRSAAAGYVPPDTAIDASAAGRRMPLYVGGRGPRINQLASEVADGAFVAGLPPFRYPEVIGWARSIRPIDIALYPSVAFDEASIEHHRPEMIWALVDAPSEATHSRLGLDGAELAAAAHALRNGDPEPARRLITNDVLADLMVLGDPETVGRRLAQLVATHQPTSIGLALLQDDIAAGIDHAAEAFRVMRQVLDETPR